MIARDPRKRAQRRVTVFPLLCRVLHRHTRRRGEVREVLPGRRYAVRWDDGGCSEEAAGSLVLSQVGRPYARTVGPCSPGRPPGCV